MTSSSRAPWRMILPALVLALVAVTGTVPAATTATSSDPEVPYVPTARNILDQMLALARPTRNDVLYDLGSGDGRIVIAAAKRFGTRGVGIDINPERIREANQNARRAGVTDRVRFIQGDLFDADISQATIVTMYLLPEVNLRLRPKLLAELRPGTRIVSHDYDLGDWAPLKTVEMGTHRVHFWVVPPRAARGR